MNMIITVDVGDIIGDVEKGKSLQHGSPKKG